MTIDEKGNPLTYWGGLEEPKQRYEKYSERFDNDESAIGNPETWGKRVLTEEDIFNQRDIDAVTDYIGKETSKQETLEEAIVDHSNDATQQLSFLNGAEWQQYKQEKFAIDFASWCIKKRIDFFDSTEIGETYTIDGNVSKYKMNELLEIYKQGL